MLASLAHNTRQDEIDQYNSAVSVRRGRPRLRRTPHPFATDPTASRRLSFIAQAWTPSVSAAFGFTGPWTLVRTDNGNSVRALLTSTVRAPLPSSPGPASPRCSAHERTCGHSRTSAFTPRREGRPTVVVDLLFFFYFFIFFLFLQSDNPSVESGSGISTYSNRAYFDGSGNLGYVSVSANYVPLQVSGNGTGIISLGQVPAEFSIVQTRFCGQSSNRNCQASVRARQRVERGAGRRID